MSTYDTILYDKQRQGVLITWNRPETLNAISRQLEHELAAALEEAERDPEVRAIVMTGMGRGFSSGYDIGGERPEPVWPYGVPAGQSVAEVLDNWRTRSRSCRATRATRRSCSTGPARRHSPAARRRTARGTARCGRRPR